MDFYYSDAWKEYCNKIISKVRMLDLLQKSQRFWIRCNFVRTSISLQKSSLNFWYHFHASK
ncbi:hypothetical protein LEP1GSC125_0806 [Leptospira mayottensis 200901122]|uniref:Uncharacterized protein n=1 Tax=Leptospira mayottensis 200901122 TaxID=1193010 RepID=A0AA87MT30_9LEPT|nr:hypothetical protein LEP1GSC125_0806 [Leptospira mayottensis 200901122]